MSPFRNPGRPAARLLPAATILFAAATLGACATVRPAPAVDHLAFDLDEGRWEPARQEASRHGTRTDLVRPGETLAEWHELFTVQTVDVRRAEVDAPAAAAAALHARLQARCPGAEWHELAADSTAALYEWRVSGCAGEADRHEIGRIVRGAEQQARLAYTVHGAMPDSVRDAWVQRMRDAAFYRGGR
ncbi:MAG TPA: hypothetical protein VFS08_16545 [Gemmatimonadaceae bacterium]|nr:hypothetical protein [Gemmatimonadaceae bacterium]